MRSIKERGVRLARTMLLGLLALNLAGCSNGFKEVATTSPTDGNIYVATLVDASAGFAVGYNGTVQYTTDGGKTWVYGNNKSMCQFSLHALDRMTCVAAGNESHVIMTEDGGKSWTHLENIPRGRAKGVSFATKDDGWVWTNKVLYSTRNSGKNWQTVNMPQGIKLIESASLQSKGNGFLCGLDGYLYRTRDNGRTWERKIKYLDNSDPTFKAVLAGKVQGTAIRFQNEHGIVAVIGMKEGKPAIQLFQSADGGENWGEGSYYFLKKPAQTITISPEMQIATVNSDSTVSMYTVK